MTMKVSIVVYHYVRELKHSRYPEINGLTTEQFRKQIEHFKKNYNIISGEDLIQAARQDASSSLPPKALLLTFDDGYIDHYTQVFPILDEQKIPACFFPPAKCILENEVLDVNKIHFILASAPDKMKLVDHIFQMLNEFAPQPKGYDRDAYWNAITAEKDPYDSSEVLFIKRMLQRELPEKLRGLIVDALFKKFVCADEASFSREIYMSVDQIKCLRRNGMYVGSHGYGHYWLDSLSEDAQRREVQLSLEFLKSIGAPTHDWIMCYPYGAQNNSLLSILKSQNCRIGLTTRVGTADLRKENHLTLPRLDTNDFPKN